MPAGNHSFLGWLALSWLTGALLPAPPLSFAQPAPPDAKPDMTRTVADLARFNPSATSTSRTFDGQYPVGTVRADNHPGSLLCQSGQRNLYWSHSGTQRCRCVQPDRAGNRDHNLLVRPAADWIKGQ